MKGRRLLRFVLLVLAPVTAAAAQPQPRSPTQPVGRWVNPHGTVKVETGPCNGGLCGWVIWASPKALDDAQAAGIKDLIGTELLRDYRPTATGRWQGQVYVPDMGRSFSSTITQIDGNRLKISGCLLGGWFCKTQLWQRS